MSTFPFLQWFWWKHRGDIALLGETSTKFLCSPRRFLLVTLAELFIHISPLFKLVFQNWYQKTIRGAKVKFVHDPRIVLLFHRNLLQCRCAHFEILFESVKCDFEEISNRYLFLQYVFKFTTWKIANAIPHQRPIIKVKKTSRNSYLEVELSIFVKKWILLRDPVPLKTESLQSSF